MGDQCNATVRRWATAVLVAGMGLAGSASAALIDRGGGLIYDNDLNITWLADAGYSRTQYSTSGGVLGYAWGMNWTDANTWVANLVYHDSVRNVDYSDWRLPTARSKDGSYCSGQNCTGSEMGHLYYTEGWLLSSTPWMPMTIPPAWVPFFDNIVGPFWTSPGADPWPVNMPWSFVPDQGWQNDQNSPLSEFHVWAVRDGDVAAIPEPETSALLLAGLGLLGFRAKRRKQKAA